MSTKPSTDRVSNRVHLAPIGRLVRNLPSWSSERDTWHVIRIRLTWINNPFELIPSHILPEMPKRRTRIAKSRLRKVTMIPAAPATPSKVRPPQLALAQEHCQDSKDRRYERRRHVPAGAVGRMGDVREAEQ